MLHQTRARTLALTLIKNFDEYTYNHSVNVAVLSLAMADALSLSREEKSEVGVAGLLHDVGKTQLALDLIRKPDGLTPAEFEEIKKHPEEGFVILGKMSHIRPTSAYMVREHHVRFDRKGYPDLGPDYAVHPQTTIIRGAAPAGRGPIRVAILVDRQGNPLPSSEEVDLTDVDPRTGRPRWSILGTVNPLLYPDAPKGGFLPPPSSGRGGTAAPS